jgi:hypothetical protein
MHAAALERFLSHLQVRQLDWSTGLRHLETVMQSESAPKEAPAVVQGTHVPTTNAAGHACIHRTVQSPGAALPMHDGPVSAAPAVRAAGSGHQQLSAQAPDEPSKFMMVPQDWKLALSADVRFALPIVHSCRTNSATHIPVFIALRRAKMAAT